MRKKNQFSVKSLISVNDEESSPIEVAACKAAVIFHDCNVMLMDKPCICIQLNGLNRAKRNIYVNYTIYFYIVTLNTCIVHS